MTEHLERAREFLAIAESGDAKTVAYMKAAEEIAAHIAETGDTQAAVAGYCNIHRKTITKLLAWRKAGYPEGTTPFTMPDPNGSLPTDRAAVSHARKVLREASPEELEKLIDALPEDRRRAVVDAALAPTIRSGERDRADRRAIREERMEDPAEVHRKIIMLDLLKADDALKSAISTAHDCSWPEHHHEPMLARIGKTAQLVDMLRMAVTGTAVDWDAELSRLND